MRRYSHIGQVILWWRRAERLSQEQLARLSCIRRATLSETENGLRSPTFRELEAVCRVFQIPVSRLVRQYEDSQQ